MFFINLKVIYIYTSVSVHEHTNTYIHALPQSPWRTDQDPELLKYKGAHPL